MSGSSAWQPKPASLAKAKLGGLDCSAVTAFLASVKSTKSAPGPQLLPAIQQLRYFLHYDSPTPEALAMRDTVKRTLKQVILRSTSDEAAAPAAAVAATIALQASGNAHIKHIIPESLAGVRIPGAVLSYCDLSGVNMSGADLSGCHMLQTNLQGANLSGAKLDGIVSDPAHVWDVCSGSKYFGPAAEGQPKVHPTRAVPVPVASTSAFNAAAADATTAPSESTPTSPSGSATGAAAATATASMRVLLSAQKAQSLGCVATLATPVQGSPSANVQDIDFQMLLEQGLGTHLNKQLPAGAAQLKLSPSGMIADARVSLLANAPQSHDYSSRLRCMDQHFNFPATASPCGRWVAFVVTLLARGGALGAEAGPTEVQEAPPGPAVAGVHLCRSGWFQPGDVVEARRPKPGQGGWATATVQGAVGTRLARCSVRFEGATEDMECHAENVRLPRSWGTRVPVLCMLDCSAQNAKLAFASCAGPAPNATCAVTDAVATFASDSSSLTLVMLKARLSESRTLGNGCDAMLGDLSHPSRGLAAGDYAEHHDELDTDDESDEECAYEEEEEEEDDEGGGDTGAAAPAETSSGRRMQQFTLASDGAWSAGPAQVLQQDEPEVLSHLSEGFLEARFHHDVVCPEASAYIRVGSGCYKPEISGELGMDLPAVDVQPNTEDGTLDGCFEHGFRDHERFNFLVFSHLDGTKSTAGAVQLLPTADGCLSSPGDKFHLASHRLPSDNLHDALVIPACSPRPALLLLPDPRKHGATAALDLSKVQAFVSDSSKCNTRGEVGLQDSCKLLDECTYPGADVQMHGQVRRVLSGGILLTAERAHDAAMRVGAGMSFDECGSVLPYYGDSCLRKLDGTLLARWQRLPEDGLLYVTPPDMETAAPTVWHCVQEHGGPTMLVARDAAALPLALQHQQQETLGCMPAHAVAAVADSTAQISAPIASKTEPVQRASGSAEHVLGGPPETPLLAGLACNSARVFVKCVRKLQLAPGPQLLPAIHHLRWLLNDTYNDAAKLVSGVVYSTLRQVIAGSALHSAWAPAAAVAATIALQASGETCSTDMMPESLAGVRIPGAVLSYCDLSGVDMSGADLSGCHMLQTKLLRTNLQRANMGNVHMGAFSSWATVHGDALYQNKAGQVSGLSMQPVPPPPAPRPASAGSDALAAVSGLSIGIAASGTPRSRTRTPIAFRGVLCSPVARGKGCVASILSVRAAAGKLPKSKPKDLQVHHIKVKHLLHGGMGELLNKHVVEADAKLQLDDGGIADTHFALTHKGPVANKRLSRNTMRQPFSPTNFPLTPSACGRWLLFVLPAIAKGGVLGVSGDDTDSEGTACGVLCAMDLHTSSPTLVHCSVVQAPQGELPTGAVLRRARAVFTAAGDGSAAITCTFAPPAPPPSVRPPRAAKGAAKDSDDSDDDDGDSTASHLCYESDDEIPADKRCTCVLNFQTHGEAATWKPAVSAGLPRLPPAQSMLRKLLAATFAEYCTTPASEIVAPTSSGGVRLRFVPVSEVEVDTLDEMRVTIHADSELDTRYRMGDEQLPGAFTEGLYCLQANELASGKDLGTHLLPIAMSATTTSEEQESDEQLLASDIPDHALMLPATSGALARPALLLLPDARKRNATVPLVLDSVLEWLASPSSTSGGGALLDASHMLDETAYKGADVQLHGITQHVYPDGTVLSAERPHDVQFRCGAGAMACGSRSMLPYHGDSCLRKLDGTLLARWQRLPSAHFCAVTHTGDGGGAMVWHFRRNKRKGQRQRAGRLVAHATQGLPVALQGRHEPRVYFGDNDDEENEEDDEEEGDDEGDDSGEEEGAASETGGAAAGAAGDASTSSPKGSGSGGTGMVMTARHCKLGGVTGLSEGAFAALRKAGGKPAPGSLLVPRGRPLSAASTSSRASSVRSQRPDSAASSASGRVSRGSSRQGARARSTARPRSSKKRT